MALKNDLPVLAEEFKKQAKSLQHNEKLFHIFEGDLETYVLAELEGQLNQNSFAIVSKRIAPINVLIRLVDKLSKIYAKSPVRKIVGSTSAVDRDLISFYERTFDINTVGSRGNEFFNLFKTTAFEPYLDHGKPQLRVLPSHHWFVYSNDRINPLRVTHFVKIMGKKKTAGVEKVLMFAYTDTEILPFYDDGTIAADVISSDEDFKKLNGANPYGKIPFVYVNRSRHQIVPDRDTDTLKMTTLIPVLLSDLNFAVMFQCFSVLYTINAKTENLVRAPNVMWNLKSDDGDTPPQIGVIKPDVDTDKVLGLIKSLMSLWMQSRNIKPGAMGDLTLERATSGIAKIVDEMDTSEDRQRQVPYFMAAEAELWDLVTRNMHPVWIQTQGFTGKRLQFSPGIHIEVGFAEQRPIVDTSKAIADQKAMIDMGLQTKKGALKDLNPDWTDEQVDARLAEVDAEKKTLMPVLAPAQPQPLAPQQPMQQQSAVVQ